MSNKVDQEEKRHCCNIQCDKEAVHSVQYSENYEDYSEFCSEHLAENLPAEKSVTVTPIDK